ncbi:MAG: ATP-binding protein [Rhodobacteraceae bacterium]|nr:ATP-binding protein [Paracoccaceae bacterium]
MSSKPALVQLHLVDYAPQEDIFATNVLPRIIPVLDAVSAPTEVFPAVETPEELLADFVTEAGVWRVVFYDRAEQAVEKGLLAGTLPSEALAQWQQNMQDLLGFQRKHRRNVLLVDRAAVCRAPQGFVTALSAYLNLETPKADDLQADPRIAGSVESVIAAQTVAQSLQARRLNGELDASSLPLEGEEGHLSCDVDASFKSYVNGLKDEGLETENSLLLMQLGSVQEELEDYSKHWERQKQQVSDLEHQLQQLKQSATRAEKTLVNAQEEQAREKKQHTTQIGELKSENNLLLMQLGSVQEELEAYYLEAKRLKESCTAYEDQLHMLREKSNTAAQNAKVKTDQLHDAERRLHDAGNELHDTEQRIQDVEGNLHGAEAALKEREQALEQAHHHVSQLQEQLHQREGELHHFLGSTSWRVTGPLRKMKDRLTQSKDQEN